MAIQDIGLPQSNEAWRTNPGTHQVDLHNRLVEAVSLRKQLDKVLADLGTIGFDAQEIAYMKNAIYLADIMGRIWIGALSFDDAITEINARDASGIGNAKTTADTINFADSDTSLMRGPIGM